MEWLTWAFSNMEYMDRLCPSSRTSAVTSPCKNPIPSCPRMLTRARCGSLVRLTSAADFWGCCTSCTYSGRGTKKKRRWEGRGARVYKHQRMAVRHSVLILTCVELRSKPRYWIPFLFDFTQNTQRIMLGSAEIVSRNVTEQTLEQCHSVLEGVPPPKYWRGQLPPSPPVPTRLHDMGLQSTSRQLVLTQSLVQTFLFH